MYKKRIGIHGSGKRSSHRTIILMKIGDKAIFAHGFSKGEKDNIAKYELEVFKVMVETLLCLNDEQHAVLTDKQSLVEVFLNDYYPRKNKRNGCRSL